ncbi:AAA family ATPase [Streptomyces europaeiscabiei]|uniref:AAA family ATPase n=1 Tax=Streptomyces europaeiscabiei TaxID=146819 RepID=UPI0029B2B54C|nr:AAA family ATPase [Streptomyces europaeiscabiei]MDX3779747.1 AAA family ATPase [Streptomyces europaeiscabiei]
MNSADHANRWLTTDSAPAVPFVTRLRVKNFRSIADVDVTFGPLNVLIGLNAAGKSNLLDSLLFLRQCLMEHPLQAVHERGGSEVVFHRTTAAGIADSLSIEVELVLRPRPPEDDEEAPTRVTATYGFRLVRNAAHARQKTAVDTEWLEVTTGATGEGGTVSRGFRRDQDMVTSLDGNSMIGPVIATDLWLGNASATDGTYAGILNALTSMRLYTPDPARIAEPQRATFGETLLPDASNLGQVLGTLATTHPTVKARLDAYLSAIVPGVVSFDERPLNSFSTVQLRLRDEKSGEVSVFDGGQLSYGTLRAAGLLGALFQPDALDGWTSLVCVDEPELGLHPSAVGVIFDALTEASERVQVIVATQSGDLLDRDEFDPDWVKVVAVRDGATVVGPLDAVAHRILDKGLATVGGLMRGDQLSPAEPDGQEHEQDQERP